MRERGGEGERGRDRGGKRKTINMIILQCGEA